MRNHAQSVADNGRCPQLCDLYYIEARLYKVERISTEGARELRRFLGLEQG